MGKALILDDRLTEEIRARRAALGIDRQDEVWDGVLHVVPNPNIEHQRTERRLAYILTEVIEDGGRGQVFQGVNVADPVNRLEDFRVPDISLLFPGARAVPMGSFIAGGPDVIVEIRSPGDETYEKMPWYARQGVREMLVIDRDTKAVELYQNQGGALVRVAASPGTVMPDLLPLDFIQRQREGRFLLEVQDREQPGKAWEI